MSFKLAVDPSKGEQMLNRISAGFGPGGPHDGRRVALGQYESVVVDVVRVPDVEAEMIEEEGCYDVSA